MKSKRVVLYAFFDSLTQIIRSVLSVYVRHLFIVSLGNGLLGLNSLFSSVLSFLSLAELGFGTVVSVCLYQSIAEDNRSQISAYMYMLKKIYWFMGMFILVVGMLGFPLVASMVNGEYEQNVIFVGYILHLVATATGYFCSYRGTLLYANQEGYIVARINLIMYTIFLGIQIAILVFFKSYYGFLVCTIFQNLFSGIWITNYVNKNYSDYLDDEHRPRLSKSEQQYFFNKFKAMLVHKISNYLIQGADNMIISVFLGTIMVGFYANYNLIVNMCWAIFASIAVGSTAGIGNLVFTEKNNIFNVLKKLLLLQHIIFSISVTGIFQLSSLFVNIVFSEKSVLPDSFVAFLALTYYIRGITYPLETVRNGAGVFEDDKWKQLLISILNIIISVLGCVFWGIQGVVLGTLVCYVIKGFLLTPNQIFRNVIPENCKNKYYGKIVLYSLVTIGINYLLYFMINQINIKNGVVYFLCAGALCVIIASVINFIVFFKTSEFKYLFDLSKRIFKIK